MDSHVLDNGTETVPVRHPGVSPTPSQCLLSAVQQWVQHTYGCREQAQSVAIGLASGENVILPLGCTFSRAPPTPTPPSDSPRRRRRRESPYLQSILEVIEQSHEEIGPKQISNELVRRKVECSQATQGRCLNKLKAAGKINMIRRGRCCYFQATAGSAGTSCNGRPGPSGN